MPTVRMDPDVKLYYTDDDFTDPWRSAPVARTRMRVAPSPSGRGNSGRVLHLAALSPLGG